MINVRWFFSLPNWSNLRAPRGTSFIPLCELGVSRGVGFLGPVDLCSATNLPLNSCPVPSPSYASPIPMSDFSWAEFSSQARDERFVASHNVYFRIEWDLAAECG